MRTKSIIKVIKDLIKKTGFEIRKVSTAPEDVNWINWMQKLLYFDKMFDIISSVNGDIVECGIGRGGTFLILAFLTNKEKKERKLWGFDSFEGFPEPTIEDSSFRNPKKGEWSGTTPSDIFNFLKRTGIDKHFLENNIKLEKGFFHETLKSYKGDSIALLHIDADLYESYKVALKELFPRVNKGGVVLFDEYNNSKWPGATKAVDEYFERIEYKISYDKMSGKYYIIK